MEFWMSDSKPAPQRKRKNVVSALESYEEYLKLKHVVLSGRMKQMQSAIITLGPDDCKRLGYKWPWRTAADSLRRLVKSMGLERDYVIHKYESDTPGVWCVMVTYDPPPAAAPHAEAPRQSAARSRKRA